MSTIVLVPGAGGVAAYWERVAPLLETAGHRAVPVELPGADTAAGLDVYVPRVIEAIDGARDVVLVAQSLGGFTATMVAARVAPRLLVFVNAMIPNPGETPRGWWANTAAEQERKAAARSRGYAEDFDPRIHLLHDVPSDIAKKILESNRVEADIAYTQPCAIERWPDVPTFVITGRDDRFFPIDFQRRVASERLKKDIETVPGGHLAALSHPRELTDAILRHVT